MNCSICGNDKEFVVIQTEQLIVHKNEAKKELMITDSKVLTSQFFCNSEQCKGKFIKVND